MGAERFPIFQIRNIATAFTRYSQFASRLLHFFQQHHPGSLFSRRPRRHHAGRSCSNYYYVHVSKVRILAHQSPSVAQYCRFVAQQSPSVAQQSPFGTLFFLFIFAAPNQAFLAQSVEQLIRNEQVAGSSPVEGSKLNSCEKNQNAQRSCDRLLCIAVHTGISILSRPEEQKFSCTLYFARAF